MKIFDSLVTGVMVHGVEVWGWKEIGDLERIHKKYIKWTLGLDRETPDYIILEEANRTKMKVMQARRAMEYEGKIKRYREESIVKECLNERKAGKGNKENLKDRLDHFKKCGFSQKPAGEEIEK